MLSMLLRARGWDELQKHKALGPGMGRAILRRITLRARGWDELQKQEATGPGMGRAKEALGLWARGWDEPKKHEALGPRAGRAKEARRLRPTHLQTPNDGRTAEARKAMYACLARMNAAQAVVA